MLIDHCACTHDFHDNNIFHHRNVLCDGFSGLEVVANYSKLL